MTHEELLAICDNYSFKDSAEPVKALRAVVELHKPNKISNEIVCSQCSYEARVTIGSYLLKIYPCPTVQTIEKELK